MRCRFDHYVGPLCDDSREIGDKSNAELRSQRLASRRLAAAADGNHPRVAEIAALDVFEK